ncbi:hypothetical protein Tco_0273071 [Tanacetum coccineum]
MLGSELISSRAVFMAIFATLPLIVYSVKLAPMFTISDCGNTTDNVPITNITTKVLIALSYGLSLSKKLNIGESHKVDSLPDTHGSPREYDVPVQENHRVLDYKRTQKLPPTDIVKSSDQYHDCSNDRSQDTHHFNLSHRTLELECAPQSPLPIQALID